VTPRVLRLLLAAVLILGGCAPGIYGSSGGGGGLDKLATPAPIGAGPRSEDPRSETSRYTPRPADHFLIAEDGTRLPLRIWLPTDAKGDTAPVRAVILALHGFNDYSNAFTEPAAEWARQGIATYAYDQRGFGAAPGRGRWWGAAVLAKDLATASYLVRGLHPGVPLYLLGESMGGAVVIVATSGTAALADGEANGAVDSEGHGAGAPQIEAPDADGIILSAPAVWGRRTMGLPERVALWIGARVAPGMVLTGQGLKIKPSDNIEMLRALGRDPLVIKGSRIDAIWGLVNLMDAALASAPNLHLPTLLLYGQRDEIIPKPPTLDLIDGVLAASRDRLTVALYEQGYHMLLRDLEAATVQRDVADWIADHAAPLRSGADRAADAWLATTAQLSQRSRGVEDASASRRTGSAGARAGEFPPSNGR
jgi:alpha-beta hydrolase superfamily lysophospholipase